MAKKKTAEQRRAAQQRLRAKVRTRGATTRTPDLSDLDIPVEAVEAYTEVFMWAADHPDDAEDLACLHDTDWVGPMAGMAFPEHFKFPADEMRRNAWRFRAWHILNGMKYTLDWPTPVAAMSLDDILQQLRAAGEAGKITLAK